jgi:hypothetical protein
MWPGAYGSKVKDHTDAPNALEREHFAKFINESSHQGVYKHLQGYENYFRRAPAHHLQNLYNEQNFRKIAREIYSHPAYAQNRYAIYAALNNYGGDIENFFTDAQKRGARSFQEVLADTQKNLEEHHQVIVEKEARFSEVEVPSRTTQRQYNTYANWDLHFFEDKVGGNLGDGDPSERHLYKLAKTRYVFEEILKTNISHWSLALEPNSYSQSSTGWVGNPGKEKLGPAKYLEVIDSKIKKLSKNSNLYFMTNDNLIKLHKNPPASTFCERLFGFL